MNIEEIKKLQKKIRIPLFLPSLVYAGALKAKHFLYDAKILKTQRYEGVKIISVGNIGVGGVGKTPLVIKLAQYLFKYGKVCVITGNYPTKDKKVNVVSLAGSIFKKPYDIPDEAYMIAKKTDSTVISSKSRKAAIELAIGLNMKYIILDDALHKRNIKKDLEICVINKNRPYEDGFYLPAGMLRELKSSIKRCDEIICVDKKDEKPIKKTTLNCHSAQFNVVGIFDSKGKKIESIKSAFAFCGIGKPKSFLESLKSMDVDIKGHIFFEDHHIYTKEDLNMLYKLKEENGAEILVTTYKDFVKMEDADVCYLDVELEVEDFEEIVERII